MRINDILNEGLPGGEYSRVLTALKLYYPGKFSMQELNTPEWHRVIANKADVPTEYAGDVIDGFVKASQRNDDDEYDANDDLREFASGGGGDDDNGEDPYSRPEPEYYSRSIDYFGQFEADHFDQEDMDDATGVFKGYWDYDGNMKQIAYFKFDDPAATGSDDPGMGWYYEPQNESVAEGLPQTLRKVVPGHAKREIDQKMDAGKFGKTDADKDANFQRYKKIQDKLKEQGVAEGAPIVVMPSPERLKKAEPKKVDLSKIGTPAKPPSTEKRGVKGRPGQRPMPQYEQGVAEVSDDEDYGPELDALKKEFGKFTTHYDRMDQDPAYAAKWRKQNTDRLNQQGSDDEDMMGDIGDEMGQDDEDSMREGIEGEIAGGAIGGLVGAAAGSTLGPIGGAIGGALGSSAGGAIGSRYQDGKPLKEKQQLDEIAPLLAIGVRLFMAAAPKIAQVIGKTGRAGAQGAGQVAKSGAEIAAKNAGQIGLGAGIYEIGSSVADIAKDITAKVGTAVDEKTVVELATLAFKYAIPAGIVLAVLYGGKKAIDSLFSDDKQKPGVAETKPQEKEADYGADYQDMVARVKKLAGLGPLKTVYDPQKRVYKNVPRAEQPKK